MKKSILSVISLIFILGLIGIIAYYLVPPIDIKSQQPAIQPTTISVLYTIPPPILKQFIQARNEKVYDRMSFEIIKATTLASDKYRLSPTLLIAVMEAESSFNINATSKANAKGLMQINMKVWKDVLMKEGIVKKEREVYDPGNNIMAGAFILRKYLDETKDFNAALVQYLGKDCPAYKAKIHASVGDILMMGISKEMNAEYMIKGEKDGRGIHN